MKFKKFTSGAAILAGWFMLSMIVSGIGMAALDLSGVAAGGLSVALMFGGFAGAFFHAKKKFKAIDDQVLENARQAEAHAMLMAEQAHEYSMIIETIQTTAGEYLPSSIPDSLIGDNYNPKKNERIFWFGFVSMGQYRTRTESYQYHGPRYRMQIAKGLSYQIGSTKVNRSTTTNLEVESMGTLVISSRGVYFTPLGLSSSGWSRTWGAINRWQLLQGAISFQTTSGKPPIFFCHEARNPTWKFPEMWGEPEIVGLAAQYASQY